MFNIPSASTRTFFGGVKMADKKPLWYENQLRYNTDYQKENIVQITLKINSKTDADLIGFLNTKENKQGYIKDLIRKDMTKN